MYVGLLTPQTTIHSHHRERGKKQQLWSHLSHLSSWNPAECFWISGAFCECSDAGNVTVSISHQTMFPRGRGRVCDKAKKGSHNITPPENIELSMDNCT